MMMDGPLPAPLPLNALAGSTSPNTSNPLLIVDSCSSEVIKNPSGIPGAGVQVDKTNTEVLKRSSDLSHPHTQHHRKADLLQI